MQNTVMMHNPGSPPAVVVYANPNDLAKHFFEKCIQIADPDLLVGYNSNVFDIPFMIYKATTIETGQAETTGEYGQAGQTSGIETTGEYGQAGQTSGTNGRTTREYGQAGQTSGIETTREYGQAGTTRDYGQTGQSRRNWSIGTRQTNWSMLRRPSRNLYAVKRRVGFSKQRSKTCGMVRYALVTNAEGRVCIDLYEIAKSEKKLHNYKLDTLARAVLGDGVTKMQDMPPSEIWKLALGSDGAGVKRVAQYCLRDALLPVYIENKEYFVRGELMRFGIFGLPINEGIHHRQTWMGVTAARRISKRQATPISRSCTSSRDPISLRSTHETDSRTSPMSRSNPYFLLGRWAGEPTSSYSQRDLEGAFVVKVTPGVHAYEDGGEGVVVATFDFSSLYPSIMIVLNIDKTTFVPNVAKNVWSATTARVLDVHKTIGEQWSFVEQGTREGIIPQLCKLLLTLRRLTIQQRDATPKHDPYYNVLHMRQQKLKITANSLYGASGVRHSPLFYFPVASTITSVGRHLLKMTISVVEGLGHQVCYGDTDSVFVSMDRSKCDADHASKVIVESVNAQMACFRRAMGVGETHGYTLSIVHENTFSSLVIFAKKKYIGRLLRGNDEQTYVRGMETLRRDTIVVLKTFLQHLLQIILLNCKATRTKFRELIFYEIDCFIQKITDKNFDQRQFVYSKMVNNIVDLKKQPHVHAAARYVESSDSLFVLGDTIEYFIRHPECVPLEEYTRFGVDRDRLLKRWDSIWILGAHVSLLSDTCYPSLCYILHKAAMPAILRIVGKVYIDVIDELAEKFQCVRGLECELYCKTKKAVLKKIRQDVANI